MKENWRIAIGALVTVPGNRGVLVEDNGDGELGVCLTYSGGLIAFYPKDKVRYCSDKLNSEEITVSSTTYFWTRDTPHGPPTRGYSRVKRPRLEEIPF